MTELSNDITLNTALFERIKTVYNQKDTLNLSTEQAMLLDKKFKNFSRNGALLAEDKKGRLREIDTELAKLKADFRRKCIGGNQRLSASYHNRRRS